MLLVYLLLVSCLQTCYTPAALRSKDINRLNWNVWLRHTATKTPVTAIWRQSFAITLPPRYHFKATTWQINRVETNAPVVAQTCLQQLTATNISRRTIHPICTRFNGTWQYIHVNTQTNINNINKLSDTLYSLLPPRADSPKRALLNIAPFFSSLFGFANEGQIDQLSAHVRELAALVNSNMKGVKESASAMSSFAQITQHRLDELAQTIQNQTIMAIQRDEEIASENTQQVQFLNDLYLHMFQTQDTANQLIQHLIEMVDALEMLNAGFISPYLIPQQTLSDTLLWLQEHLHNTTSDVNKLYVIYKEPNFYYRKPTFVAQFIKSQLVVILDIPLTAFPSTFDLYQILNFPQPIPNNSEHMTVLTDVPFAIAIASDRSEAYQPYNLHYYMTQREFESFELVGLAMHFRLFHADKTCIMAIYYNIATDIRSACNFSITLDTASTQIDYINQDMLLLTHVPTYNIQCGLPDGTTSKVTYNGCTSCLVKLNTHCSLYLPDRFTTPYTAAITPGTDIAVKYLINAPVLAEFLPPEKLQILKGDFQSLLLPNITLPNFRFAHDLLQAAMASDDKLKLNLKESVNQIKNNDIIVGRLSEHMMLSQQFISGLSFFTTNAGIVTTTFATCIIALIIAVTIFHFKLRKVTMMLMLASQMRNTAAASSQFNYFASQPDAAANTTVVDNFLQTFMNTHSHTVALFTVTIILAITTALFSITALYTTCSAHHVKDPTIRVWLQILSGDTPVSIHVLTLHGLYQEYKAMADTNLLAISLHFTCTGLRLNINWPTLRLRDQITQAEFFLKRSYMIGPITAMALRRKLHRPFIVLLLATTRDQTHRIDVHSLPHEHAFRHTHLTPMQVIDQSMLSDHAVL